ncbi:MAG TPA: SagB family peptide dehydrogenase [Bryobacteraceae bacterium]|jgi:SagB-type dehydrogenase family enzyme|nr:SagB family peptide dehydrogenase [Bryobacteraceae bacterium]
MSTNSQQHGPRILDEIVFVPIEDGVLIEGLGRPEIIRGPVAQTILPDLLKLMDGKHTTEEIAALFPADLLKHVQTATSLLTGWGLVESDLGGVEHDCNPETLAFLKRSIASAALDASASAAYTRLRKAEVIVIAADAEGAAIGNCLTDLLEQSGVGSVRLARDDGYADVEHALVIDLGSGEQEPQRYAKRDKYKIGPMFGWLRALINEGQGYVDVGPLFKPGTGTCYECFRAVHCKSQGKLAAGPTSAERGSICASLIALEIIAIVAHAGLALSERQFRRIRIPDWTSEVFNYPRLPGCRTCRNDSLLVKPGSSRHKSDSEQITDTAIVFEDCIGLESRTDLSSGLRERFVQNDVVLSEERKRFPNCERTALSRENVNIEVGVFEALRPDERRLKGKLTIENLGVILAMTAGISEIGKNKLRRWAATAGNLGSVEAVVIARRVERLEKGVYFYEAEEHALAAFRKRGALEVEKLMLRALGRTAGGALPDVLIILTGAFHRVAQKYGPFAYRLINLDAGVAASQLQLVAGSLGLRSHIASRWADDLIEEELNLNSDGEQVTAVIELSGGESGKAAPFARSGPGVLSVESRDSWNAAGEFEGLTIQEITRKLRHEARLRENDLYAAPGVIARELLDSGSEQFSISKLSKPLRAGLSVGNVLGKRRSLREYADEPIGAGQLETMLYYAHSGDAAEWQEEHECGLQLTYLTLVRRVSGLKPAVYRYDPVRHALAYRRPALSRDETIELLVQGEYADAPLLIWIAGNLAAACARHGAHGHRQLLVRAGAAGNRLWMAALGAGLKGSILAGLIPGAARKLLSLDGYKKATLFAFTAGY